jgi:hypothetical protein
MLVSPRARHLKVSLHPEPELFSSPFIQLHLIIMMFYKLNAPPLRGDINHSLSKCLLGSAIIPCGFIPITLSSLLALNVLSITGA